MRWFDFIAKTSLATSLAVPVILGISPYRADGQSPVSQPETSRIVTRATETVEIAPDRAMITVAVETKERTAAGAGAANARIQAAVIDTLKKLGIASAQLRTSGVQINPEYQYPPNARPILTGYRATNSVRVEIRQLGLVGGVIDGALARGATRVDGLSFFASETENCGASPVALITISARGAESPNRPPSSANRRAPGTTSHMQHAAPK